ncbi:hypothetical protein LR48_Vigan707s001300 [Vigna angularis]|uniref:Uncharacterized protein n=1 Tax=Phaseolus angularis TaxID=3914 RepID=A0A0L9TG91_PHAAN|nr:uncharacterized protein HKW66_Vig0170190 [Vigna angularis]KOM29481.1 hypothetical protein LR48_Vigan707s001300 [Vigna angularis]
MGKTRMLWASFASFALVAPAFAVEYYVRKNQDLNFSNPNSSSSPSSLRSGGFSWADLIDIIVS